MKTDPEIGNIVVIDTDGSESHILLPDFRNFDDDREIQKYILNMVMEKLGAYDKIDNFHSEEQLTHGLYTIEAKSYQSRSYRLDIIEDELYVGASGGTEQIILALLSGAAGGIAGAITTQIYSAITDRFASAYDSKSEERNRDSLCQTIEKILIKRFKASKPLKFIEIESSEDNLSCVVMDSNGLTYDAKLEDVNGFQHLNIKNNSLSKP